MFLNLVLYFSRRIFKLYLLQVSIKVNVFIQNNIIRKTAYYQINFLLFLKFCLGCSLAFLNLSEKFRQVLPIKDLLIKKRVNSNLNADQIFLKTKP